MTVDYNKTSKVGVIGEEAVATYLRSWGFVVYFLDENVLENRGKYDLSVYHKAKDLYFNIEVKHDEKSQQTGNYAVEMLQSGFPSGLQVTEAHLWCFYCKGNSMGEMVFIATDRLRELVNMYKMRNISNHSMAEGYLIPCDELLKVGISLNPKLNPEQLFSKEMYDGKASSMGTDILDSKMFDFITEGDLSEKG